MCPAWDSYPVHLAFSKDHAVFQERQDLQETLDQLDPPDLQVVMDLFSTPDPQVQLDPRDLQVQRDLLELDLQDRRDPQA